MCANKVKENKYNLTLLSIFIQKKKSSGCLEFYTSAHLTGIDG